MLRNLFAPMLGMLCFLLAAPTTAAERGSPDEARAMAVYAAEALRVLGRDAAFPAFQTPGPPFHDRDLYIAVLSRDGVVEAHGIDPALAGQNRLHLTDSEGRAFVRDIIAVQDEGWVHYRYKDPISGKVLPKQTYVVRVGDYLVCVGAYTEESEPEPPVERQSARPSRSR